MFGFGKKKKQTDIDDDLMSFLEEADRLYELLLKRRDGRVADGDGDTASS